MVDSMPKRIRDRNDKFRFACTAAPNVYLFLLGRENILSSMSWIRYLGRVLSTPTLLSPNLDSRVRRHEEARAISRLPRNIPRLSNKVS